MKFWLFVLTLSVIAAPACAEGNLPRLKVVGNHLETPDGRTVTLRGVSLCSLDWHQPLDLIRQISDGPQSWPVNVIRLPVQEKEWKSVPPKAYLTHKLDPAVALCSRYDKYCIIDWHAIRAWDDPETAKALEQFWRIVAIRYANNPNILYEVFNEPTSPSSRNRGNWMKWRETAQKWVNIIRKDAPDTLILVGSPHWSQMPSFAVKDPFEGENLSYVMHLYPNWKRSQWDSLFGEAAKHVPIFMTEWGWSAQDHVRKADNVTYGTKEEYGIPLKDYLKDKPSISWTAWSYDPLCGPAMLGDDREMGAFVKTWLEETQGKKPSE